VTGELRTYVDIDAPPEKVWAVLADLAAYPQWNPFVTSAEGAFRVGDRPTIDVPPVSPLLRSTLRPDVLEVEPARRLRFRLRWARLGVPGVFDTDHTLTLDPRDGGVRLWEEAVFSGLLVPLVSRSLNRERSPDFAAMNEALKDRVERGEPTPAG
jgi:hypothetical protein